MKLQKNKKSFLIISVLASISITSLLVTGCEDKSKKSGEFGLADSEIMQMSQKSDDHAWYSFANDSFVSVSLPQNSSSPSMKPWTESIRISDGNTGSDGNGYFLINHIGALVFEKSDIPTVINEKYLLSKTSSSNLVFIDKKPFFTISRNTTFNKELDAYDKQNNEAGSNRPYLVGISTKDKMIYPCITYGDLHLRENEEISGSHFDGESKEWTSSVKFEGKDIDSGKDKVSFRYIKWTSKYDFANLSAQTQANKLIIKGDETLLDAKEDSEAAIENTVTEDDYRKVNLPIAFSKAPSRLKLLLSSIPDSFDYILTLRVPDGDSPKYYSHGISRSTTNANALMSDRYVCAVFADGTTYFSGALDNRAVINNNETVAFRLPKLPKNYFYTNFCISGDYLIVGWEENDFYETARSGFLTVDMAKLFY